MRPAVRSCYGEHIPFFVFLTRISIGVRVVRISIVCMYFFFALSSHHGFMVAHCSLFPLFFFHSSCSTTFHVTPRIFGRKMLAYRIRQMSSSVCPKPSSSTLRSCFRREASIFFQAGSTYRKSERKTNHELLHGCPPSHLGTARPDHPIARDDGRELSHTGIGAVRPRHRGDDAGQHVPVPGGPEGGKGGRAWRGQYGVCTDTSNGFGKIGGN